MNSKNFQKNNFELLRLAVYYDEKELIEIQSFVLVRPQGRVSKRWSRRVEELCVRNKSVDGLVVSDPREPMMSKPHNKTASVHSIRTPLMHRLKKLLCQFHLSTGR